MPTRFRPRLELVEARLTPAFPTVVLAGSVLVPDPTVAGLFRVVAAADGTDLGDVTPFPDWAGGEVRAATLTRFEQFGSDLVVAAGPGGGARVRVFDGQTREPRLDFFAFEPEFRGGVYLATADVTGDGWGDIVVGAGEGGAPRVRVFDGRSGQPVADFLAFETEFRGGVRVAAGDVAGDGRAEIVAGAGPGGAPRVAVFSLAGGEPGRPAAVASFFAYDPAFRGGVSVGTTGDFGFRALPEGGFVKVPATVVTVPGVGGGPVVKGFDGATGAETHSFFADNPAGRSALTLASYHPNLTVPGVVVSFATPAGPSLVSVPLDGGDAFWVRPPGSVRTFQAIASVDLTSRVVTFRGGGSAAVRPDTVLRFDEQPVTLDFFRPGDGVVTLVGPGGELLGIDGRSPPPPPVVPQPVA